MARPKVSPAEKRSVRFSFRLTETEHIQLLQFAHTCGKPPGNVIRQKLFTGRFPVAKTAQIDVAVYAELKKIGVNVNQLARQVNSGTVLTAVPAILEALLRQQDKIINLLIRDRDPEIGKSFAGALNYNLKKMNHPNEQMRAELLDTNFSSLEAKLIAREVELIRSLKPNLNRYVYHTTLNFSNQDFLESEQMLEIAKEYLEQSGYTNNQYAIFRHYDAEHLHVHLLVNRITFDGEVVSDSNNYKRSEEIVRKLEAKYNLISVAPSKEAAVRAVTKGEIELMERTGKPSAKLLLQELMNGLLATKGMDVAELIEKGEVAGIHFLFNQATTGRVSGITYFYGGLKIRGQALGNRYKWAELIKTITYEQGKHGQGISQANSRTTAKYGKLVTEAVGATAEAGGGYTENEQTTERNRQTVAQAGRTKTELPGRNGQSGGAGKGVIAANLDADAAQRQSERRVLAGIAADTPIGRSADRSVGRSADSAGVHFEPASQANPPDHTDPGAADRRFDRSTDAELFSSIDKKFYGLTEAEIGRSADTAFDDSTGRALDRSIDKEFGRSDGTAFDGSKDTAFYGSTDKAFGRSTGTAFNGSTDKEFDRSTDSEFYDLTEIQIADDIDDEAIHGRNRHRQKKARTNRR